ncbi:hypothetical protein WJX81_006991 [Elliptochloris bilobata]|uniref:PX domain-containing protein n=1 Tax=Elliptochloris bilobata TaxID=381761 RepID=A0AAW1RNR9_9CHLO
MSAEQDPLSRLAFAEEGDVDEDVPIDDDEPHDEGGLPPATSTVPEEHRHQPEQVASYSATTQYDQLMGATYDDSHVFERGGEIEPQAAGQRDAPVLKISVKDPVKKVEASMLPGISGGHVTYRVDTSTTLPGFARPEVSVRRRFREFVALGDLLKATHRGYVIPPRPEKSPVEGQRASADFVEARRAALEHYLHQLAAHPVLSRSQELRVFLEAEGALAASYAWQQLQPLGSSLLEGVARLPKQLLGSEGAIPAPAEAAKSTKATGDLLRRFKELGQSMRNDYKEPPPLDDAETNLRNAKLSVEEFQEKVMAASRKAERLVTRLEEVGGVLGDLGLALIKAAKYEDEEGARSGAYTLSASASKAIAAEAKRVGTASLRLSRTARQATAQATLRLSPLHDHLALSPAICKALRERESALLTVQALEEELEKKRRGVAALEEEGRAVFGGDKGKTRRVAGLNADKAALEAALLAARAEYERVRDRNLAELQRCTAGRSVDFAHMLDQFADLEENYSDHTAKVWREVAAGVGGEHSAAS